MTTTAVNAATVEPTPEAILARMEVELTNSASAGTEAWPVVRHAARNLPRSPLQAILLTGCGDSYYAALALRSLLEARSDVPTFAQPAMESVAFPSALFGPETLVVGISVSGKVERTIQAVTAHADRGGPTVSVSAFADSDLGKAASTAIATGIRGTPGPVPGTANFLGSLLGIVAIAAELGERRGLEDIDERTVTSTLAGLDAVIRDGMVRAVDEAAVLVPPFFSIGSGPDLGVAWYGVAKFIEAAATVGVAQDLEEWAHEQYFTTHPETTVFVHAGTSGIAERATRVAGLVAKVGARLVTISRNPLGVIGEAHWPMPSGDDRLRPLVDWAPVAMTALAYARAKGRYPFGIDVPKRMATVDEDIYLDDPSRA